MKASNWILAAVCVAIVAIIVFVPVSLCVNKAEAAPDPTPSQAEVIQVRRFKAPNGWSAITRFHDTEMGIVCYSRTIDTIHCVKVTP